MPALASTIDYGNSNFDLRHRAAGNIFYQLPFGRSASGDKALLTRAGN